MVLERLRDWGKPTPPMALNETALSGAAFSTFQTGDSPMGITTIQWADYTFNPWVGCQRVSPGVCPEAAEAVVEPTHRVRCGGRHDADHRTAGR